MDKLINFLNTEYDSTWLNLITTILITVSLTLVLQTIFADPIKSIINWIKQKIKNVFYYFLNKLGIKERFAYIKIIYHERKMGSGKNIEPLHSPPGIKFKEWKYYIEKIKSGKSFAYPKLEAKFKWYRDTFPERLEKYHENNPDKKIEWEAMQERLRINKEDINKAISKSINLR